MDEKPKRTPVTKDEPAAFGFNAKRCEHMFDDTKRCGSLALKGYPFCQHHIKNHMGHLPMKYEELLHLPQVIRDAVDLMAGSPELFDLRPELAVLKIQLNQMLRKHEGISTDGNKMEDIQSLIHKIGALTGKVIDSEQKMKPGGLNPKELAVFVDYIQEGVNRIIEDPEVKLKLIKYLRKAPFMHHGPIVDAETTEEGDGDKE